MLSEVIAEKRFSIPIGIFLALNGLIVGNSLLIALFTGQLLSLVFYVTLYLTISVTPGLLVFGSVRGVSRIKLIALFLTLLSLILGFTEYLLK